MTRLLGACILGLLLAVAFPTQGQAVMLANVQAVTLDSTAPLFQSAPVTISPLTSTVTIRLQRPTTANPLAWEPTGRLRVMLVMTVDGVEHRTVGHVSGGIRSDGTQDLREYVLAWTPSVSMGSKAQRYIARTAKDVDGYIADVPLSRLGETGTVVTASVRLEWVSGTVSTAILDASTTEAAAPTVRYHNSVAFDAATSVQEQSGDGVVSLTHTATGSDGAAFVGIGAQDVGGGAACTSATYNAVGMTEIWDFQSADTFLANCGYRLAGPATSAQTVTSTLSPQTLVREGMIVITMTGVDQTTPVGTGATTTGTASPSSVTVGSVGADDLVVDNLFALTSSGATIGANQTQRDTENLTNSYYLHGSTQSGADGGVMSWTFGAVDTHTLGAVAFKPATAGAETFGFRRRLNN